MASVAQSTLSKRPRLAPATYTLAELAGLLAISYTQAHERAKQGTLPVQGFQIGRGWRFPKAEVDRLLRLGDDEDTRKAPLS
jgi:excisionase family DNA binding protein